MENNRPVNELPADQALNRRRRELELLPEVLVRRGTFISSAAVLAALNAPPEAGMFRTEYGAYVYYIALFLLFLFGMWLIFLGWVAEGDPEGYYVLMRKAIRATELVLVFAVGLHEFHEN